MNCVLMSRTHLQIIIYLFGPGATGKSQHTSLLEGFRYFTFLLFVSERIKGSDSVFRLDLFELYQGEKQKFLSFIPELKEEFKDFIRSTIQEE